MFTEIVDNRYAFYQITGKTPETFIELLTFISLQPSRELLLSQRNRLLMFIMYPTNYFLSNLFSISVPVVGREITNNLPLFCEQVKAYLVWPTVAEWRAMRETWAKLPSAVDAIDSTSHSIYRPEVDPQGLYYSSHRHLHCTHTQVVVDVHGTIRYIESGYQGHLNDAQQYALMQEIGTGLQFPDELVLLGDKIYPSHGAVITPYISVQLARKQPLERR